MSKDDLYYIRNMLDFARKITALLQNITRAIYDEDEPLRVTFTHWLQVIGEAARQVSPSFQETHPAIPWKPMIGMRNRIVHDYLGIDDNTVWETVTLRIPELIAELEKLIPPEESKTNGKS